MVAGILGSKVDAGGAKLGTNDCCFLDFSIALPKSGWSFKTSLNDF